MAALKERSEKVGKHNPHQYGKARRAMEEARENWERCQLEYTADLARANKSGEKAANAKEDLEAKEEAFTVLQRKTKATSGPAAGWRVGVAEQCQKIDRYARQLGEQGEGFRKEAEGAMAHLLACMETAATQMHGEKERVAGTVANSRSDEGDDDEALLPVGGQEVLAGKPLAKGPGGADREMHYASEVEEA